MSCARLDQPDRLDGLDCLNRGVQVLRVLQPRVLGRVRRRLTLRDGLGVRVALLLLALVVSGCLTPATLKRARGEERLVETIPELAGVERALMTESGTLRICARADVKAGDQTEPSMFWIDVPLGKLRQYADRKELEPNRHAGFDSRGDVSNSFALKYVVRQRKFEEGCPEPGTTQAKDDAAPKGEAAAPAAEAAPAAQPAEKPATGSGVSAVATPGEPAAAPEPTRSVQVATIDRPSFLKYRNLEPEPSAPDTVYFSPIAGGGGTLVYVSRDSLWQGPFELLGRQRGPEERRHVELVVKLETGKKTISIAAQPAYYLLVPFAAIADVALAGFYLFLIAG